MTTLESVYLRGVWTLSRAYLPAGNQPHLRVEVGYRLQHFTVPRCVYLLWAAFSGEFGLISLLIHIIHYH